MIPPDQPLPTYSRWDSETRHTDGPHAGHFKHDSLCHPWCGLCSCGQLVWSGCTDFLYDSSMPKVCGVCEARGLTAPSMDDVG